jgi:DNA repair photolyase
LKPEYREQPCKTALNRVRGMSFKWSLNPYMGCVHRCTFCYVRHFEHRASRAAGDEYGARIRVKTNIAEVLRKELARKSWRHEHVAVGAATDPYQPLEGKYRLTRACLEALVESRTPFWAITRGPLVVRDRDVLAAARGAASITFSIPTLHDEVWRKTEPDTASPRARLEAVRMLAEAGVEVAVGMAPILPGLTDDREGMAAVVRAARDHGASAIWANVLFLREGTKQHFIECLARDYPHLAARYEELYRDRAYVDGGPTKKAVTELAKEIGLAQRRAKRHLPVVTARPPQVDEQLELVAINDNKASGRLRA